MTSTSSDNTMYEIQSAESVKSTTNPMTPSIDGERDAFYEEFYNVIDRFARDHGDRVHHLHWKKTAIRRMLQFIQQEKKNFM